MRQYFEREFNGSPVRRAGFMGLRRNVAIAMGNSGRASVCASSSKRGPRRPTTAFARPRGGR